MHLMPVLNSTGESCLNMLRESYILVSILFALSLKGYAFTDTVSFTIRNNTLNKVDSRVFGHFLERASFGEPGFAALELDSTGFPRPEVVRVLREMNIPVIRFPAGSDMPKIDWRDMIDNVPGRNGDRPLFQPDTSKEALSNAFGIDEFLRLCDTLGSEPILVVNFYDAFSGKRTLREAAFLAAGLVAYCNAPAGAQLPEGMPDWPSIRANNGRTRPWNVKYFHIGNEIHAYWTGALYNKGIRKDSARTHIDWYLKCLFTYMDSMKSVDSSIQILTDANAATKTTPEGDEMIHNDERWNRAPFLKVIHSYRPMAIRHIRKNGENVDPDSLSDEEVWNAWVATPSIVDGVSRMDTELWDTARKKRWNVAATEWNWNGWWALGDQAEKKMPYFRQAQGLGAAGWLHAFMRDGDLVKLGCQSMLVGVNWGITSVRIERGKTEQPYLLPTGMVTALYSNHHGSRRLSVKVSGVPSYRQPHEMGSIRAADSVKLLDAVATATDSVVYFHVINRSFDAEIPINVEFIGFENPISDGILYTLRKQRADEERRSPRRLFDTSEVNVHKNKATVALPSGSVTVIEFPVRTK